MRAQRCEANGKEQLQWQFAAHVNCIQMASWEDEHFAVERIWEGVCEYAKDQSASIRKHSGRAWNMHRVCLPDFKLFCVESSLNIGVWIFKTEARQSVVVGYSRAISRRTESRGGSDKWHLSIRTLFVQVLFEFFVIKSSLYWGFLYSAKGETDNTSIKEKKEVTKETKEEQISSSLL
jgi:hypothetical protein